MGGDNSESSTYKLTAEQRQFYEDNGYLVIKGLIEPTTLDNLRNRFSQIVKKEVSRGKVAVILDNDIKKKSNNPDDYVNKINHLSHDEVFMEYTEHPRLMDVLSQLIGEQKKIFNSMLINKPSGSPSHPVHQDVYHIPFQPLERIVTAWTAIDAAHEDNGCLYLVPGSHKANKIYEELLLPGFVNSLFFVIKDEEKVAPIEKRVTLCAEPGDTIIMHALMVHGSLPNKSERHRKAITCIYGSNCQYFDVAGTIQEPFKVEVLKELKSRGHEFPYEEYWESKSKEIQSRG